MKRRALIETCATAGVAAVNAAACSYETGWCGLEGVNARLLSQADAALRGRPIEDLARTPWLIAVPDTVPAPESQRADMPRLTLFAEVVRATARGLGVALPLKGAFCCYVSDSPCLAEAEWILYEGDGPEDYTHACTEHVGHLLTDAPEHRVVPLAVTYVVPKDTTLEALAADLNRDVIDAMRAQRKIRGLNPGLDPERIAAGQQVLVPERVV